MQHLIYIKRAKPFMGKGYGEDVRRRGEGKENFEAVRTSRESR